ncbi:MAG: GAF domain-containing sensor histidine kinase [Burkholderiaceae bacterium]
MDDSSLKNDVALIARISAVKTILEVVCRTTGMGFAAVARVTDTRWVACEVRDEISFGLQAGGELEIKTTICDEIRDSKRMVVIDHVATDPLFAHHHTPRQYGFQSYISAPIFRASGEFFGTLCAIHPAPAEVSSPAVTGMFRMFADLIGFHLDAQDRLAISESALNNERANAELREQFIAVLGHDLRNPLASISAGSGLMRKLTTDEKTRSVLTRMDKSILRISGLIDNVLDFARGRLGGGFTLLRSPDAGLQSDLEQVVAELQAVWPERRIDSTIHLDVPVDCDRGRMSQMLSNLLANALAYGDVDKAIRIDVRTTDQAFEMAVSNHGVPIAPEMLERLFQPFFRATARPSQEGLGLGLFIVLEIARAHGGTLDVVSTDALTRFTFSMPLLRATPL